jgi:hypothetical protein
VRGRRRVRNLKTSPSRRPVIPLGGTPSLHFNEADKPVRCSTLRVVTTARLTLGY